MVHERFAYEMPADAEARPLRWLLEPVTRLLFDWQTNRRFARMRRFLQVHAGEVRAWQQGERGG
jgi:hypothetical protein